MNDAQKIQTLLDIVEIKELKANYCVLVDRAQAQGVEEAKKFAALFADEFELDLSQIPGGPDPMRTHESMINFFGEVLFEATNWTFHSATNPILDVTGDSATGQWSLHAQAVLAGTPVEAPPLNVFGEYDEEYVRTADGWKFAKVLFRDQSPPTAA